jgi:short-chain fatty acids transporter
VWGTQNIFTFALQMTLILVCGYTLAQAPLIERTLRRLASLPHNQSQAAVLVFLTGAITSFFNWGLGLVVGTLLAKEMAKRMEADFAYLVAAAYMGFITWASGFSSSIVLANADPASSLNWIHKMTGQTVPVSETLGAAYNLVPVVGTVIVIAVLLKRIQPQQIQPMDRARLSQTDAKQEMAAAGDSTFAFRLERAWIFNLLVAAAGLYYFFIIAGATLKIDTMIMLFTVAGLLFHGTPIRFIKSERENPVL